MRSKIKSSFRLRLTLMVLLAIIIPTAGVLLYATTEGVRNIEDNAKRELSTQADSLTNSVVSWDEGIRLAVRNLSQQPIIQTMDPTQQKPALESMADIYTGMYLIHTVDTKGDNIARSDDGENTYYGDREWFKGSMAGNDVTIQTVIGRTTGEPALTYSSPIRNINDEIIGATLAATDLDILTNSVGAIRIGETGFGYLVDENGVVLAHPDPSFTAGELVNLSELPPVARVLNREAGDFEYTDENGVTWFTHLQPLDNGWGIVVQQEKIESQATVTQFLMGAIVIVIAVLILIGFLVWLVAGREIRPIFSLTNAATAFTAGNLNQHITIKQQDEIGTLATAFNSMTEQIRGLVGNLEQRVTARTRDLELANEIGRNVLEIHDSNQLLADAVKIIHDGFNLYLAQIYLVEDNQETLLLHAAEGQAANRLLAQGHFLAITTASINGTAVSEKRAIIVPDTAKDPLFRPNPLLPDTRSEMAVPLLVNDRVIGVLDIQSTIPNTFTEENVPAFVAMAGQLAIALENASLFNEREAATTAMEAVLANTEQQAYRLTGLNEMGTSLAAAAKLDDVYQIIGSLILTLIEGDRASLALITETGDSAEVFALQGEKGAIPTGTTLPFTGTAVGLAIQENSIVQLPKDSPLATYADSRQLAQKGLRSLVLLPLNASGHVVGTLNIGSTQSYAFSESDINFAQQIAALLASTIDRLNLVERVQGLATLVENHPDFIGIGTLAGEALYINPAGLALLGLPADFDITSMGATDFYIQEDAEQLQQEGIPTALETGSWTAEVQLQKADGTTIPVEQTIAINYDTEGKATNFSITMRDITNRKQAAEAQNRLSTQLEERLLQVNAMQRAMTHEGWSAFLTSPNRLVQGFKFNEDQIGLISTRDVAQGNVPGIITQTDSDDPHPPDLSTTAVPVDIRGQTIGIIGAKNTDGTPLSIEQSTLLSAMSQQVATALDRARLFEEMEMAREQMNSLYSGSERVIRATSIDEVLIALVESTKLKIMDTANFLFFSEPWDKTAPDTMTVGAIWEKVNGFTPEQVNDIYKIDLFPSMYNINKDEPTLFYDIATDERAGPDAKMLAEQLNVKSVMYFPLIVGNQWFGLLSAKATNNVSLAGDEIKQITGLVDQAATVSQTQRLFTQAQTRARREQLLREVGTKVYAAPDAESIMKTAVKEVNRIMGIDSFVYLDAQSPKQEQPTNGSPLATEETTGQEG